MITTINATDLTNKENPLKTVTPAPDPIISSGTGIISNAINSITQNQLDVDNAQKETKALLDKVSSNQALLKGKSADVASADELAGVNAEQKRLDDYNQELNSINANVKGLATEAKAIPMLIQEKFKNSGATDAGVAPIQTGELRQNAIKALTQSALADIATANINNSTIRYNSALIKSQKAIALKYEPIETEIANLKEQLTLNKTYITDPAEKRLLANQEKILNERSRLITEKKTEENAISNIKLEVAKNDPSKLALLDGVKTIDEAIAKAGSALQTPQTDVVKLDNGQTILIDKKTGKTIRNLGGATADPNNLTIPSAVVRTVQTEAGATPVSGYTLQAGDDPYFIAKQNGTDMETLKKLNPNIQDWTKLQVGAVINLPNSQESWLNGKTSSEVQAYNSIPDNMKASIKQLVNGDALLTDIVKSRGAKTQSQINQIITMATSVDPSFSVNTNKLRYTYKQQFNNPNGKAQLQINAINTGLGHLAEFKKDADALGNKIFLPYNKLVNYLNKNIGDPKVAKLNTVITALAGELASIYKGGNAPTDQETEEWRNTILASFSKEQIAGVSSTTSNLIANKILSFSNSYKSVMGSFPDSAIINNDIIDQLNSAGVNISAITGQLKKQGYSVPESSVEADTFLDQFSPKGIESSINNSDFFNQFK